MNSSRGHSQGFVAEATLAQKQLTGQVINALNETIAICMNAERGFLLAIRLTEEKILRETFAHYAEQRRLFVDELQSLVLELEGRPEKQGDVAGFVHRLWMRLKVSLSRDKSEAILRQCLLGERASLVVYADLLSTSLPGEMREVVERQRMAIRTARERLQRLRDASAA